MCKVLISTCNDNLFLKNTFKVFCDYTRDTTFTNILIKNSFFLVFRISSLNIDSNLLFIQFLRISRENYFNIYRAFWRNRSILWIYSPYLPNLKSNSLVPFFSILFGIFLCIFFSIFFAFISPSLCYCSF